MFSEDPADGRGVALNVVAANEGSCEGKQGRMRLNSVPVVDQSGGEGLGPGGPLCVWKPGAGKMPVSSFQRPSDFRLENNEATSLIPEDLGVGS